MCRSTDGRRDKYLMLRMNLKISFRIVDNLWRFATGKHLAAKNFIFLFGSAVNRSIFVTSELFVHNKNTHKL